MEEISKLQERAKWQTMPLYKELERVHHLISQADPGQGNSELWQRVYLQLDAITDTLGYLREDLEKVIKGGE